MRRARPVKWSPSPAAAAGACLILAAALGACASTFPEGPEGDRRLYEAKCGMCHVPFHRSEYTPAEWPAVVAQFAPRAGLTKRQRERVLRYLTSEDGATTDPGASSASPPATR